MREGGERERQRDKEERERQRGRERETGGGREREKRRRIYKMGNKAELKGILASLNPGVLEEAWLPKADTNYLQELESLLKISS